MNTGSIDTTLEMAATSRNPHESFDCNDLENHYKKNLPPRRADKASVETKDVINHAPDSEKSFIMPSIFLLQFHCQSNQFFNLTVSVLFR